MSKKSIRPEGSEGTSHARNVAKRAHTVKHGLVPAAASISVDGFKAAEQWHAEFDAAAEAAGNGYIFPTKLRSTFESLPIEARGDFLDGIGVLMAGWHAYGEPAPGCQKLREDAAVCLMTKEQQDRHYATAGGPTCESDAAESNSKTSKGKAAADQAASDLFTAKLHFDCMQEDKEKLRALISVLQGLLPPADTDADVIAMLDISAEICADHAHWFKLSDYLESLGNGAASAIEEVTQ